MSTPGRATSAQGWLDTLNGPIEALPDPLPVLPIAGPCHASVEVRPPGSKSLTNRLVLLAALAKGESRIDGALLGAEDTELMMRAVRQLGATVRPDANGRIEVRGVGGRWSVAAPGAELMLGNAGTAVRFLAAASVLARWPITIDGSARMRHRPIGGLVEGLQQLGARVEFQGTPFCPPIRVLPPAVLPASATVTLGELASSQFVSALMLVAPFLPGGLTIQTASPPPSRSYIDMSQGVLDRLGVKARASVDARVVRIEECVLEGFVATVEPDASSATYPLAAAMLVPGLTVRVLGLPLRSLQGDARFADVLAAMGGVVARSGAGIEPSVALRRSGIVRPIDIDLDLMPDTAMSLAVVAACADGPSTLHGLGTLRVKESDRIEAMRAELGRVGVLVEPLADRAGSVRIVPPQGGLAPHGDDHEVAFETYDDHRMAMSLALLGLVRPGISVRNPRCVAKTYPTFWADLAALWSAAAAGSSARARTQSTAP